MKLLLCIMINVFCLTARASQIEELKQWPLSRQTVSKFIQALKESSFEHPEKKNVYGQLLALGGFHRGGLLSKKVQCRGSLRGNCLVEKDRKVEDFFFREWGRYIKDPNYYKWRPGVFAFFQDLFPSFDPFPALVEERKNSEAYSFNALIYRPDRGHFFARSVLNVNDEVQVHLLLADDAANPMSMFGHSALRIVICREELKVKGGDCLKHEEREDFVINFGAKIDQGNLNPIRGLGVGPVKKYPFDVTVTDFESYRLAYTHFEKRSLQSLPIDLCFDKRTLFGAIAERSRLDAPYEFLTHNCSVGAMELLFASSSDPRLHQVPPCTLTPAGLKNELIDKRLVSSQYRGSLKELSRNQESHKNLIIDSSDYHGLSGEIRISGPDYYANFPVVEKVLVTKAHEMAKKLKLKWNPINVHDDLSTRHEKYQKLYKELAHLINDAKKKIKLPAVKKEDEVVSFSDKEVLDIEDLKKSLFSLQRALIKIKGNPLFEYARLYYYIDKLNGLLQQLNNENKSTRIDFFFLYARIRKLFSHIESWQESMMSDEAKESFADFSKKNEKLRLMLKAKSDAIRGGEPRFHFDEEVEKYIEELNQGVDVLTKILKDLEYGYQKEMREIQFQKFHMILNKSEKEKKVLCQEADYREIYALHEQMRVLLEKIRDEKIENDDHHPGLEYRSILSKPVQELFDQYNRLDRQIIKKLAKHTPLNEKMYQESWRNIEFIDDIIFDIFVVGSGFLIGRGAAR